MTPPAGAGLWVAGIAAFVSAAMGLWVVTPTAEQARARIFDAVLGAAVAPDPALRPVVVDIDRTSLALVGPWPWSREKVAGLVDRIADAGATALAVDIFFAGPDRTSPAALVRRLKAAGHLDADFAARAPLPDGDAALAGALSRLPTVVGALLDPAPTPASEVPLPSPPILMRGPEQIAALRIWSAAGLASPPPTLRRTASIGLQSLAGDADGPIRRVPLLGRGGDWLGGGLALEVLRRAHGDAPILLDADSRRLRLGPLDLPLGAEASLRLVPLANGARTASRVSAMRLLLGDPDAKARLAGRIVLLGGTAPELGGVRPTAGGGLAASVELQADAVAQMRGGLHPVRPAWAGTAELGTGLFLVAVAALAAWRFSPARGLVLTVGLCALWPVVAVAATAGAQHLLDPALPPAAGLTTFALASLAVAAEARFRATRLRSAFEQHLAPAVVRRIADRPDLLRLSGEQRTVTALFTDIEGFSALTERAAPEDLVALLDGYFDGLTRIATDHGGMIDKIVGDAVHALFNVPVDLADHGPKALACAEAILAFAAVHRQTPIAERLAMGRTRIGLESGAAIVGNIGGARKLDYTAHGPAVNAAARFEQMNKSLGTDLLAGPGLVALLPEGALMPLGPVPVRGMSEAPALATLWPASVAVEDRPGCADLLSRGAEQVADLKRIGVPARLIRGLAAARGA